VTTSEPYVVTAGAVVTATLVIALAKRSLHDGFGSLMLTRERTSPTQTEQGAQGRAPHPLDFHSHGLVLCSLSYGHRALSIVASALGTVQGRGQRFSKVHRVSPRPVADLLAA
jgi:hypothetical protein